MLPLIVIGIAIAAALIAGLMGSDSIMGVDLDTSMQVVAAVVMISLLGAGTLSAGKGKYADILKAVLGWAVIGLVVVGGYAYRFELAAVGNRVAGVVVPGLMLFGDGGETTVSRGTDGQFHFSGAANGQTIRLMFDTGASSVVLRDEDARAIGIRLDDADYTVIVRTANGTARAAPVTLRSLEIGGIREENVRAMVAQPGRLSENLLGMTFLERLSSYEVRSDQLTLRGRGR
jgi:aspartyl protease family protein